SKLSLLALKLVPELHRALQRPAPLHCRSSDAAFLQGGTQFGVNARQLIAQESVGGIFGQDGFAGLRRLAKSLDAGRSLTRVDYSGTQVVQPDHRRDLVPAVARIGRQLRFRDFERPPVALQRFALFTELVKKASLQIQRVHKVALKTSVERV